MSRRLHSSEPWSAVRERPGADASIKLIDLVCEGGLIGTLSLDLTGRGAPGQSLGHPDDDVRRVVECVNACDGVDQPEAALEAVREALAGMLEWLSDAWERAEEEGRVEILAETRPPGLRRDKVIEAKKLLGLSAGERLALELMGRPEEDA